MHVQMYMYVLELHIFNILINDSVLIYMYIFVTIIMKHHRAKPSAHLQKSQNMQKQCC